jgi:hypothetical protein
MERKQIAARDSPPLEAVQKSALERRKMSTKCGRVLPLKRTFNRARREVSCCLSSSKGDV